MSRKSRNWDARRVRWIARKGQVDELLAEVRGGRMLRDCGLPRSGVRYGQTELEGEIQFAVCGMIPLVTIPPDRPRFWLRLGVIHLMGALQRRFLAIDLPLLSR
jgi:hypothetical protein